MNTAARIGRATWGWSAALAVAAGLSLLVARAPLPTSLSVLALASGAILVHQFGVRLALWFLFVATLPLRVPLSIDVVGTRTIFLNDVLLLVLFIVMAYEHGFAAPWRSISFRLGVALFVLSVVGLYGASRLSWGANFALCMAAQAAIFHVGWYVVRSGRIARWTLIAFLAGMVPAALYGLHESTFPVNPYVADEFGRVNPVAWDAADQPHIRIKSTFDHQLRCSLAFTTSAAIAMGLAVSARRLRGRAVFLAAAGLFIYANQFTYSIGGIVGNLAAFFTVALLVNRTLALVAVPLGLLAWLLLAQGILIHRVNQVLAGEQTTALARIIGYRQALHALRDHPVFGLGWGNIRTAFEGEYQISREEVVGYAAENYFLQYAVALGLVGLAITLTLCVRFFKAARSKPKGTGADIDRWPRAALLVGGTACWAQAQTFASTDYTTAYILWMLLVLAERMRVAHARAATPILASQT